MEGTKLLPLSQQVGGIKVEKKGEIQAGLLEEGTSVTWRHYMLQLGDPRVAEEGNTAQEVWDKFKASPDKKGDPHLKHGGVPVIPTTREG
jgi:hypothetical protein